MTDPNTPDTETDAEGAAQVERTESYEQTGQGSEAERAGTPDAENEASGS